MKQKILSLLTNAIENKVFPGCAAAVIGPGEKPQIFTSGHFTYDTSSRRVDSQSIFDVASITKAIPVSCIALKLIESGVMHRGDLLKKYVPSYRSNYQNSVTINNLLTQTLHFDFRLSQYKDNGAQGILDAIFQAELISPPGSHYCYANSTSILLGLAIESCTSKQLDQVAEELFFGPLSMKSTTFFPEKQDQSIIVPTEIDQWRGRLLCGEIHDESAWALRPLVIAGSAGLFTNIKDLSRFVLMLLNEGTLEGVRIFSPEMIHLMATNQIPSLGGEWTGLGWELNQESFMGKYRSPFTFGKTGFTGCSVVVDPVKNRGVILLTNHVYPRRSPDRSAINRVRSDLADIVLTTMN